MTAVGMSPVMWRRLWLAKHGVAQHGVSKHGGPGPHAGTGTPQSVHGGPGASASERSMLSRLGDEGGFTWDDNRHLTVMGGVAVSPYKDAEVSYSIDEWRRNGAELVRDYMAKHRARLDPPDAHLGGWADSGRVYLDISVVKPTLAEAVEVAKANDQLGVFDLDTFTTYLRGPDGEYRPEMEQAA